MQSDLENTKLEESDPFIIIHFIEKIGSEFQEFSNNFEKFYDLAIASHFSHNFSFFFSETFQNKHWTEDFIKELNNLVLEKDTMKYLCFPEKITLAQCMFNIQKKFELLMLGLLQRDIEIREAINVVAKNDESEKWKKQEEARKKIMDFHLYMQYITKTFNFFCEE